jgi:uncharacterized protein YdeI (YjbR/CyaY-like superfamily)
MAGRADIIEFLVRDVVAWRAWLDENEDTHDGVWLVLAKQNQPSPTTLTYDEALDEALCSGWIDGQKQSRDDVAFLQRFTPRRATSIWSLRNVGLVGRLEAEGRMRPRGLAEVERAKADGRWDRAYRGGATMEPTVELRAAFAASPAAEAAFAAWPAQERYAALFKMHHAKRPETRQRHAEELVARLLAAAE